MALPETADFPPDPAAPLASGGPGGLAVLGRLLSLRIWVRGEGRDQLLCEPEDLGEPLKEMERIVYDIPTGSCLASRITKMPVSLLRKGVTLAALETASNVGVGQNFKKMV